MHVQGNLCYSLAKERRAQPSQGLRSGQSDIQEKHAIALIRTTFEICLDCTTRAALQGCRQRRTEESMRKVGGWRKTVMPAAIEVQEEA